MVASCNASPVVLWMILSPLLRSLVSPLFMYTIYKVCSSCVIYTVSITSYALLSTGGGSCFSAGTMITLASGEEMAIEKQRAGLKVISSAGDVTTMTNQLVGERSLESMVRNHLQPQTIPFGRQMDGKALSPKQQRKKTPISIMECSR